MKNIFRIIKISKPFHRLFVAIAVLILVMTVVQLAAPLMVKMIVDEIEKQVTTQTGDLNRLYFLVGAAFGFSVLGVILNSLTQRLGDYTTGRLGKFLTEKFYRKIFTLPQKYFDSEISGKIINQLNRGIISIKDFLGAASNFIIPSFVRTIFVIGVLAYYNIPIALLALSIFPVYIGISHYSTKRWGKEEGKKNRIEDVVRGRIQEVISNIKLVRSYNNQKDEWNIVSGSMTKSVNIYDKQSTTYHLLNVGRNFGLEVILILIMLVAFRNTFNKIFTLGEMVLILQLLGQLRQPLFAMSFILERVQNAEAGSKEFFEILSLESTEKFEQTVDKRHFDHPSIEFKNVYFHYEKDENVLKDVNFHLNKKETIALVGHSGAGKTTVVNLILKFYEPSKGKILLNNIPYNDLTHEDVRSHIALVFQESELFSSTVFENVAYGKKGATDEEVTTALKKANAYEFVSKLPKKIHSEIGERGVKLSGGQKQRIQIARAILHDAPILILDEATSSLDAKSEKLVQEALENLMKDRLVIIIAHRFSTIQNVDRILVIEDGKIADSGKPQELAKRKGIYSELLRYQIEGNQKLLEKYELR